MAVYGVCGYELRISESINDRGQRESLATSVEYLVVNPVTYPLYCLPAAGGLQSEKGTLPSCWLARCINHLTRRQAAFRLWCRPNCASRQQT